MIIFLTTIEEIEDGLIDISVLTAPPSKATPNEVKAADAFKGAGRAQIIKLATEKGGHFHLVKK